MSNKIVVGIGCILLILMLKPYFEVNSKMLVGSYVENQEYYSSTGFPMYDSIYIYADNTYKRIYITSKGEIVETKDRWEYIPWFREIRMEQFMGSGSWYAKVEKAENEQLRIYYATEEGIFYYKNNK